MVNSPQERYQKRLKDAGLCRNCRKPRDGQAYCKSCRAKRLALEKKRYRKNVARPVKKIRPRHSGTITSGYLRVLSNGRRMMDHRRVMEEMLHRELLPEESVHHKNGDRLDNRPENLELWSTSHPSGQRVEDQLRWARKILNLYAPGVS
jgi:hypothetical protein